LKNALPARHPNFFGRKGKRKNPWWKESISAKARKKIKKKLFSESNRGEGKKGGGGFLKAVAGGGRGEHTKNTPI
jgi:hypothetical protein